MHSIAGAFFWGGTILPDCRSTECWDTPSLCDGSRPACLGQPPIQEQTSKAGVYTNLHLYNVRGRYAVGARVLLFLKLGLEWGHAKAFQLCCHLCYQATRCGSGGGQRQESLKTFLDLLQSPQLEIRLTGRFSRNNLAMCIVLSPQVRPLFLPLTFFSSLAFSLSNHNAKICLLPALASWSWEPQWGRVAQAWLNLRLALRAHGHMGIWLCCCKIENKNPAWFQT